MSREPLQSRQVRGTKGKTITIVRNFPGLDADMSTRSLREMAAQLLQMADAADAADGVAPATTAQITRSVIACNRQAFRLESEADIDERDGELIAARQSREVATDLRAASTTLTQLIGAAAHG